MRKLAKKRNERTGKRVIIANTQGLLEGCKEKQQG